MWNRLRAKLSLLAARLRESRPVSPALRGAARYRRTVGTAATAYGGAAWLGMPRNRRS